MESIRSCRSPTARRNFPTDTDGTDHIWLSGGYDSDGATACLDGNLQLPAVESHANAYCDGNGNCNCTATATATASDLLRLPQLPRPLAPRGRGIRRRPGRVPHRRLGRKVCFSSRFFGDSRQLASPRNCMYSSSFYTSWRSRSTLLIDAKVQRCLARADAACNAPDDHSPSD